MVLKDKSGSTISTSVSVASPGAQIRGKITVASLEAVSGTIPRGYQVVSHKINGEEMEEKRKN